MNKIVIVTIITVVVTFQIAYSQNLSDYKWKNRILILSDIDVNSTNSKSAYKLLDKEIEAWKEREVIFLFLNNGKLVSTDGEKIKYDIELPK